ncbi:MAG: DsbA family protein [Pseudomonadota bacterium]
MRNFYVLNLIKLLVIGSIALSGTANAQDSSTNMSRAELIELIDERIRLQLQNAGFDNDGMGSLVEQKIIEYVQRQREQAQNSQNRQQEEAIAKAQNVKHVSVESDRIYGDVNAPISLIEYSDFECPYCKRFHKTAKQIVDENPGIVNWVFRHFPLHFHNPGAMQQALAAECAYELGGNDSFWQYTDAIFDRTTSNGRGFSVDKLLPLAEEIGLDGSEFSECFDSQRHANRINQDLEEGAVAGVTGTPGNFLLHRGSGRVIPLNGAQPYERVAAALSQLQSQQ